jgi:hypothetical protein
MGVGKASHFTRGKYDSYPINLDDPHIMSIDPKEEHREGTRIDDAQPVSLSWDEGQRGVFIKSDSRGSVFRWRGGRRRGRDWRKVAAVVGEVHQAGIWERRVTLLVEGVEERI